MSTNPNNAVGTNAAYSGRTSAKAFNDSIAGYSAGILSGWACVPSSGLTVTLGGNGTTRDVAIAENNTGDKTTVNNISGLPIDVAIGAAPATNSRIDLIVAYVESPPQGSASQPDNPSACGIIAVAGTASASPVPPSEANIRSAITADGGSGTTAYYAVLADITIASGTTDLTANNITQTNYAQIGSQQIAEGGVKAQNIDFTTFNYGVHRTASNQSIPANTPTTVLFPVNDYIDTEGVTYSDGVFTIQKAGTWFISAVTGGSSGSLSTLISVNGTEYMTGSRSASISGVFAYSQVGACVRLSAGDTVEIKAYSSQAFTIDTPARGVISMCMLSPANA